MKDFKQPKPIKTSSDTAFFRDVLKWRNNEFPLSRFRSKRTSANRREMRLFEEFDGALRGGHPAEPPG
jgi:hypothetical protein